MRRLATSLTLISAMSALALVARPAAADVTYELENGALKVPHPVVYKTGKADVDVKQSAEALGYVAGYLEAKSYISRMRIEVHADSQGADEANQRLTEKRALAVARALVAKGVDCKRLLPVGFGETKPVADNKTAEGRAANRRTMFINAELRGRAIGGMPLDGGGVVAGDPCQ